MFFPQGVVAAALTQFDLPPSWFVALNVDGEVTVIDGLRIADSGHFLDYRGKPVRW